MSNSILHHPTWARTSKNTAIELFRKAHTNSAAPLLFVGGVHGDEPEGVRLAQDLLHWLRSQEAAEKVQQSWILIPCWNVDGFANNERTNARGVDLNRNFPTKDWSAESKAPRYSPGPSPASEPEVQSLVKLIEQEKPSLIVHFHSWEPCVVYSGSGGQRVAEMLAKSSGLIAREEIGYPTPGSLGQFGLLNVQIPVICIEAQEHLTNLDTLWPQFGPGLRQLLCQGKP